MSEGSESGGAAIAGEAVKPTRVSVARTFDRWLAEAKCSLAFTSYQTGQLFLVGLLPNGRLSWHQQTYSRAMGLHAQPQQLYLGTLFQIWRFENALAPNRPPGSSTGCSCRGTRTRRATSVFTN